MHKTLTIHTRNLDMLLSSFAVVQKPWLHVKQNYLEIILKLFQCFITQRRSVANSVYVFSGVCLFVKMLTSK